MAVFILSIAMVTIIGNFIQSTALASETGYQLRLSILLHSQMDQLFTRDVIYEETTEGNFPEPYETSSYRVQIVEEERRYSHSSFPVNLPDLIPLYRINVTISIPVGNRVYEFQTHTYYNHLEFLDSRRGVLRFRLDE